MDRDQIIREDFPVARKGWDPDAVRTHLRAVADASPDRESGTPLADGAAERVRDVIGAAEEVAARIEEDSRREAEEFLNSIRTEAEGALTRAREEAAELVASARTEAAERVEQAKAAVEGLISQADDLRSRVGDLGDRITDGGRAEVTPPAPSPPAPGPSVPTPSPDPVPPPSPDPTPPTPAPDPGPPVPEPDPGPPVPEPDPGPPVPEPDPGPPVPDPDPQPPEPAPAPQPAPDPQPPEPEPAPTPPSATADASTEDLIAQLRGGGASGTAPIAEPEPAPAANGSADSGAIRLVAMNMALEGASREEIEERIGADFGASPETSAVIDDVLSRSGRV